MMRDRRQAQFCQSGNGKPREKQEQKGDAVYTCMHVYIYIHINGLQYIYIYTYLSNIYIYTDIYIYIYVHMYIFFMATTMSHAYHYPKKTYLHSRNPTDHPVSHKLLLMFRGISCKRKETGS